MEMRVLPPLIVLRLSTGYYRWVTNTYCYSPIKCAHGSIARCSHEVPGATINYRIHPAPLSGDAPCKPPRSRDYRSDYNFGLGSRGRCV